MPRAILTNYFGQQLSLTQLKRRFGICTRTSRRWLAAGVLNEDTIAAHLLRIGEQRRLREQARANGISDGARRMRVYRGHTHEFASLDWHGR